MLKENTTATPFIAVLKLSTGEEIIAKVVEETMFEYTVKSPLQMVMAQQGPQFAPWMMMADPAKTAPIKKVNVISYASPNPGLESQYESITSGIALPQKSALVR